MTTITEREQKIESCNKVIDHVMDALEHAADAGMGYSALRSALDQANSCRARLRYEVDRMLELEESRPCSGCGAECEEDCGCPDTEDCVPARSCRVERDMPSWDAGM